MEDRQHRGDGSVKVATRPFTLATSAGLMALPRTTILLLPSDCCLSACWSKAMTNQKKGQQRTVVYRWSGGSVWRGRVEVNERPHMVRTLDQD